MTDSPRHFVVTAAGRKGPYAAAELRQMAADGFLAPDAVTEPEAGGPPAAPAAVLGPAAGAAGGRSPAGRRLVLGRRPRPAGGAVPGRRHAGTTGGRGRHGGDEREPRGGRRLGADQSRARVVPAPAGRVTGQQPERAPGPGRPAGRRAGPIPVAAPAPSPPASPPPAAAPAATRRRVLTWAGAAAAAVALLGYEWARPLTAREAAVKAIAAKTATAAGPYCTPRMTALMAELDTWPDRPDAPGERLEVLADWDGPAGLVGKAIDVHGRLYDADAKRLVAVSGFLHLLDRDGWKVDDLYFTAYDGRAAPEPVSMAAAVTDGRAAKPAARHSPPARPAAPAPATPARGWARLFQEVYDWGSRHFGAAGGVIAVGVAGLAFLAAGGAFGPAGPKK